MPSVSGKIWRPCIPWFYQSLHQESFGWGVCSGLLLRTVCEAIYTCAAERNKMNLEEGGAGEIGNVRCTALRVDRPNFKEFLKRLLWLLGQQEECFLFCPRSKEKSIWM